MTAATALAEAEARAIAYADSTLSRAASLAWPHGKPGEVAKAEEDVRDAIETHHLLKGDRLHWEAYDHELRIWPEPRNAALQVSAIAAEELADWLAEMVERHAGRDAAEYVSGTGATTQEGGMAA